MPNVITYSSYGSSTCEVTALNTLLININKLAIFVLYRQKLYAKLPNVTPQSVALLF
jgi:hypothetical protein